MYDHTDVMSILLEYEADPELYSEVCLLCMTMFGT